MFTRMAFAYSTSKDTANTQNYEAGTTNDFEEGAVLVRTAGLLAEAAADPTAIVGIATHARDGAPGYNLQNQPSIVTARRRMVTVVLADESNVFGAKIVNGSGVPIAVVAADQDARYGITKFGSVWYVDKAKTAGSARVVVVKLDFERNIVFFKFLAANRAIAP